MVHARATASRPEVAPEQTIRFGPPNRNQMATVLETTLLDALGASSGLISRMLPCCNFRAILCTVAVFPRLELATTAVLGSGAPSGRAARGCRLSAPCTAQSASGVEASLYKS